MYDVDDRKSFENTKSLVKQAKNGAPAETTVTLMAVKVNLVHEREVSTDEGIALAE